MFYDNQSITSNGNVVNEDGANNNLEISVVKCRISTTVEKDYINDLANANHSISKIDKLISEIENIDFSEPLNCTNNLSNSNQAFTQGDYLNEIKLNRKKNTSNYKGHAHASSKASLCAAQMPSVVKLDPNKYGTALEALGVNVFINHSIYSNFSYADQRANLAGRSQVDNSLKLYGKKM